MPRETRPLLQVSDPLDFAGGKGVFVRWKGDGAAHVTVKLASIAHMNHVVFLCIYVHKLFAFNNTSHTQNTKGHLLTQGHTS